MFHTETCVLTIMHAKWSAHNYFQEGNTRTSSVPVKMELCTSWGAITLKSVEMILLPTHSAPQAGTEQQLYTAALVRHLLFYYVFQERETTLTFSSHLLL